MADVSDRGQLILVLGVVVGTVFVVLALLLNTVIFTENLASRGTDFGEDDAIEYRATVEDAVAGLLAAENERNHTTRDPLYADVTAGIDEVDTILIERYVQRGVVANVSNVTVHNGSKLVQDDDSELTDNQTAEDWTLATDIEDTRNFTLTVTGALNETDKPAQNDNAFSVQVEESGGGDVWKLFVHEDTAGNVELAVKNGSVGTVSTDVCNPPASPPFTINLTGGRVDGTDCGAIQFGKGVDAPYDIRYEKGTFATGTYNLTINVSGAASVTSGSSGGFNAPPSHQSPFVDPVVYSARIDTTYEAPQLRYRARVNVTPEGSP